MNLFYGSISNKIKIDLVIQFDFNIYLLILRKAITKATWLDNPQVLVIRNLFRRFDYLKHNIAIYQNLKVPEENVNDKKKTM